MPLFDYTGQTQSGAAFRGTLESESLESAAADLAAMGVNVTTLHPTRRTGFVTPLSLDDLLFFNEQLAALTKSDIPLERGLRQLAADVGSRRLKRMLLELADDLAGGTPLEQAIEKQSHRFPTHYAGVVQAGIKTGDLGGTLYGVTSHLRLKSTMRKAVLEMATYPLAIVVFTLVILSFVMRQVVPMLEGLVNEMMQNTGLQVLGAPPPIGAIGPMALVFRVARHWPAIELTAVLVLVAMAVAFLLTHIRGGRVWREGFLLRVPGFSQVYRSSVLARFSHTTALAAFTGTPLPELLRAGGAACGCVRTQRAADRVAECLEKGESLEDTAQREPFLPALWTCVVSVSGPRGELPAALTELARTYEARAEHWVRTVRLLLGPLLMLFVGTMLGGIILSLGLLMVQTMDAIMGI